MKTQSNNTEVKKQEKMYNKCERCRIRVTLDSVKRLKLVIVNKKQNKTKPGGGSLKYNHTTKFDLSKYGIYKPNDDSDYSENGLVIDFREGGVSDER